MKINSFLTARGGYAGIGGGFESTCTPSHTRLSKKEITVMTEQAESTGSVQFPAASDRFCKDCVYFTSCFNEYVGIRHQECNHPSTFTGERDLVEGYRIQKGPEYTEVKQARLEGGFCGPGGVGWIGRVSIWSKLFGLPCEKAMSSEPLEQEVILHYWPPLAERRCSSTLCGAYESERSLGWQTRDSRMTEFSPIRRETRLLCRSCGEFGESVGAGPWREIPKKEGLE